MTTTSFHWTKQSPGFYTLDGTDFAVASSWKQASEAHEERTGQFFVSGVEWAVVRFRSAERRTPESGENLGWYDTMRDAKAYAEDEMAR